MSSVFVISLNTQAIIKNIAQWAQHFLWYGLHFMICLQLPIQFISWHSLGCVGCFLLKLCNEQECLSVCLYSSCRMHVWYCIDAFGKDFCLLQRSWSRSATEQQWTNFHNTSAKKGGDLLSWWLLLYVNLCYHLKYIFVLRTLCEACGVYRGIFHAKRMYTRQKSNSLYYGKRWLLFKTSDFTI